MRCSIGAIYVVSPKEATTLLLRFCWQYFGQIYEHFCGQFYKQFMGNFVDSLVGNLLEVLQVAD